MNSADSGDAGALEKRGMEAIIRIGVAIVLLAWCFLILRPFIQPIAWGMIIAVATHALYHRIESVVGGRRRLAAALYILLGFAVLMTPTLMLTGTLVNGLSTLAADLREDGALDLPAPPPSVAEWPVIGEQVYAFWHDASVNLESTLKKVSPDLKGFGSWLLSRAARVGVSILLFMLSIIIAGILLAHASGGLKLARDIAIRLAGERGEEFTNLAIATVRSVARGVLGVALIQAILAGIGFLAVGLHAAGLWALVVLFAAVVQLPVALILAPLVIYVFALTGVMTPENTPVTSMTAAVVFAVWCVAVSTVDNILKPILLGRGAPVPMAIIFMGVIGGFVVDGIIGLFTGAIVLSLGYKLFLAWLNPQPGVAHVAE